MARRTRGRRRRHAEEEEEEEEEEEASLPMPLPTLIAEAAAEDSIPPAVVFPTASPAYPPSIRAAIARRTSSRSPPVVSRDPLARSHARAFNASILTFFIHFFRLSGHSPTAAVEPAKFFHSSPFFRVCVECVIRHVVRRPTAKTDRRRDTRARGRTLQNANKQGAALLAPLFARALDCECDCETPEPKRRVTHHSNPRWVTTRTRTFFFYQE